ncbi:hypothetical protein P389DRAFT_162950 [Cystobasidium minutum MCA 4210]|uniref:uncharacterized protein n=1 Tax=Cystobasidium minutum MCA 4210 TaxID=1397322 RepID=UPI0034CDB080|eukprot:jgi/Rhomi1/162950/estExt_Genewise1Plus.C_6_t20079
MTEMDIPKELLITLETTGRPTNLTLTDQELHVVSIDDTPRSWASVLLCQVPIAAHRKFPYLNVLDALLTSVDGKIFIDIKILSLRDHEGVASIKGTVEADDEQEAGIWVEALLAKAYNNVKRHKHLRILINPNAGAGKSRSRWTKQLEPIFRSAGCTIDVTFTEYGGHAKEIVQKLDVDKYDAIVVFSGDGLFHEAINGLCKRPDAMTVLKKCPLGTLPGGSGNALACSLNGPKDGINLAVSALTILKGHPFPLDICSITQGTERYFTFLSQAYGLMADVDLGTEHMRWMGSHRFVVGFIQRAIRGPSYDCEISMRIIESDKETLRRDMLQKRVKSQEKTTDGLPASSVRIEDVDGHSTKGGDEGLPPLRFGTVNDPISNGEDAEPIEGSLASGWTTISAPICTMYAGQMPYLSPDLLQFPVANSDGTIVVSILPVVSTGVLLGALDGSEKGKHYDNPKMEYYKVEAYRLTPKAPQAGLPKYISIDGEHAPYEPFQVEAHAGLGQVLSLRNDWYLPPEWTKSSA